MIHLFTFYHRSQSPWIVMMGLFQRIFLFLIVMYNHVHWGMPQKMNKTEMNSQSVFHWSIAFKGPLQVLCVQNSKRAVFSMQCTLLWQYIRHDCKKIKRGCTVLLKVLLVITLSLLWTGRVSSASASTTLPCLNNTYCTVFHCTWALPNCIDLLLPTISFLLLPLLWLLSAESYISLRAVPHL